MMAVVGGGAQAELAVVHERAAMPVPGPLEWPQAGGLPEVFTTAHDALCTQAALRPGEHLLVHGAAGGVGTAAVQLGRMTGARVTATVRREELRAQVEELGATRHRPGGLRGRGPVRRGAGAGGSVEPRGQPGRAGHSRAHRRDRRGRHRSQGEINLLALMQKHARIHGSTLRARPLEQKAAAARLVEKEVLPGFEAGLLTVPVAETFELDRVEDAYARFEAGGKLGKIVLLP